MRRSGPILLILGVVVLLRPAHAATVPPAPCESAKLVAAANASRALSRCHATAVSAGVSVDPTCVGNVQARLVQAFTGAESRPCVTTGEAPTVGNLLAALGADLATIVGAGPSKCDARKLLAAGKRSKAGLKAHASHAKTPERERLGAALAKARFTFERHAEKADAGGGCSTTGNAAAIGTRLDAGVTETTDAVRGTLRAAAAHTGRRIGAAVRANLLADPAATAYRDLVLRQVSTLTAEYEFMWGNMEPVQGAPIYGPIDTVVDFAEQHDLPLKGAPLVWHVILPPWVNPAMTAVDLQTAVDTRIDTLVGTYAGRVATWDVVNEAVVDFGAALRPTIFLEKLGADYIRAAFVRARAADPNALLFYNDFLADGLNVKSDFIYALIVDLLAQGAPIDGVSFQMHLGGLFGAAPSRESIRQNLQRFADLGLIVRISEMDVQINMLPGEKSSERLAQQRAIHHDVVAACVAVSACDSITFWGITDRYSWIEDYLGVYDRPLPFDHGYRPKPAFFGVRDALLGY